MSSPEATTLWQAFAQAPEQIDLPLEQRREAGERAETPTSEPHGVAFSDAPEVGRPVGGAVAHRAGSAGVLYLFGGGYVLGSPASRRKTAGHLANTSGRASARTELPIGAGAPVPGRDSTTPSPRTASCSGKGVDPDDAVIVGDSSGGGLAFATGARAARRGRHVARRHRRPVALGRPPLRWRHDGDVRGRRHHGRAVKVSSAMAEQYLGGHDATDPLASPVYGDLGGMPPSLAARRRRRSAARRRGASRPGHRRRRVRRHAVRRRRHAARVADVGRRAPRSRRRARAHRRLDPPHQRLRSAARRSESCSGRPGTGTSRASPRPPRDPPRPPASPHPRLRRLRRRLRRTARSPRCRRRTRAVRRSRPG